MNTIDRSFIRKIRSFVQWSVLAMVLYAGITFYFFVDALERGVLPAVKRSPSIEGFLPIGALMSLRFRLTEGSIDPAHPAALVIFAGALALSLLVKKSFCSWICPVGAVSELAAKAGRRTFGRHFNFPNYADYALRSIKYVLMGFFLFIILIRMSSAQIAAFLQTPYWKVADVKLLKFFTAMSVTTKITLSLLFMLSLFYRNFWCRYLCPYGGLLGLLSLLSPVKIQRNESSCIQCGRCSAHCPSQLPVSKKRIIRSPECTGCLTCVSYCPAEGTLDMSLPGKKLQPVTVLALIITIFFGAIVLAKLAGTWDSSVPLEELRSLMPFVSTLAHP